jgi:hypothetical protein
LSKITFDNTENRKVFTRVYLDNPLINKTV